MSGARRVAQCPGFGLRPRRLRRERRAVGRRPAKEPARLAREETQQQHARRRSRRARAPHRRPRRPRRRRGRRRRHLLAAVGARVSVAVRFEHDDFKTPYSKQLIARKLGARRAGGAAARAEPRRTYSAHVAYGLSKMNLHRARAWAVVVLDGARREPARAPARERSAARRSRAASSSSASRRAPRRRTRRPGGPSSPCAPPRGSRRRGPRTTTRTGG